ncbi:hypothetical protein ACO0QE_002227 [Hanseniaspora vineae]
MNQESYHLGTMESDKIDNYKTSDMIKNTLSTSSSQVSSTEQGDVVETKVQRGLKSRHISMIALGGTIGTGLFISTATPLQQAGPFGALLSMSFLGLIAFSVTQSLGEMTCLIPVTSSFTVFTKRFLSPALGSTVGYSYAFSFCITLALEISVVGSIVSFWTDKVSIAAWNIIIWVIVVIFNMMPVGIYGEVEFWCASIKVIAIFGFLIFGLCMVCGAKEVNGFKHIGFHYWNDPGAFGAGIISKNINEARFLGFVNALVSAAFSLQGIEVCAISAGEAQNPSKTIKKAINKAFLRIILFYVGSLFFIGMLVPYNDPKYSSSDSFISASPFLLAIENCKVKVLPHIFNAVILSTVVSAANSDIYIGSRVFYSLATQGQAPKILKKTTKLGTPIFAVALTSAFGFLSYLQCSAGGQQAFNWLLNCTTCLGATAWIFTSFCHTRFRKALKARNISLTDLPFKAKLVGWRCMGPWGAGCVMTFIIFIQGFPSFCPFDYQTFLADYISVIIFFVLWGGFHFYNCLVFTPKQRTLEEDDTAESKTITQKLCNIFKMNNKVAFKWQPLIIPLEEVDIDSDRMDPDDMIWEANGTESQEKLNEDDEDINFTTIYSSASRAPKGQKFAVARHGIWESICNLIS